MINPFSPVPIVNKVTAISGLLVKFATRKKTAGARNPIKIF